MSYLKNCWYAATWSESLESGKLVPLTLLEQSLVFYRDIQGAAVALDDMCPHRLVPLHLGKLLPDGNLQCGYHGLEFDSTGRCVKNPHGSGRVPRACAVRKYEVVEKHSLVWIWLGDQEPDRTTIPEYSYLDEGSGHDVGPRQTFLMDANYRNVVDNLMDLSHASFLHHDLLGNEETIRAEINVKEEGPYIFVRRDMHNVRPPLVRDLLFKQDGARVSMWNSIRWSPPCNLLNDVGTYVPGTDPTNYGGQLACHILTPQTATTTLYLTAAARQGPLSIASQNEEGAFKKRIADLRRRAFMEQDDPMLRAQQENMRKHPGAAPVFLEIDAAPVRCQRRLDSLINAEQNTALQKNIAAT